MAGKAPEDDLGQRQGPHRSLGLSSLAPQDEGGYHHPPGHVFLFLDPERLSLAPSCIQELRLSRAHSRCSVNTGGTNELAREGANERYSRGYKLAV